MEKAESQKEHQWLQKLVGEWTYEGDAVMEPGKPREKFEGTESVRSIGDLWVLGEGRGEMPDGSPATMIITLGYDPLKRRYVGTWIGSMMTHMWVYDGELDADEKVLTLSSDGPSMKKEGKLGKFKDVIEIQDDDHRTLTGNMLGEDGKWQELMTARYRRTK